MALQTRFRIGKVQGASNPYNPATWPDLVEFDQAPWRGEYDNQGDAQGLGSVYQTLGGIVVQDFGVRVSNRRIMVRDDSALKTTTVTNMRALYGLVDTQFYFSDGWNIFRVQFSRDPAGWKDWLDIHFAERGRYFYSYEMNLIVLAQVL